MVVKITIGRVRVLELNEKAVSKKQQRFFGMVRAAQKGEGAASPEVAKVAGEISKKDAKDFAKTKHKGLPEKKEVKENLLKKLIDREKRIMFHPGKTKEEYEELKKKIGSKKKHDKPAVEEATSFQQFMADTKAAKDRQKKKIEDRKKKDAQFVDTRKQGVKFYDKKGSGRIKSGKKIYDK